MGEQEKYFFVFLVVIWELRIEVERDRSLSQKLYSQREVKEIEIQFSDEVFVSKVLGLVNFQYRENERVLVGFYVIVGDKQRIGESMMGKRYQVLFLTEVGMGIFYVICIKIIKFFLVFLEKQEMLFRY